MSKATRRLSDFDFSKDGAHVALVGKHQGGPANGVTTLITKSTSSITQEQIAKAATVQVELQFPEFLRKFFGLYWEDSEVLSSVLGYGRTEYPDLDVKDYIDQRVESINIMKSVYLAQNVEEALAALTPDETLAVLKDQAMLEKALGTVPAQPIQEEPIMETILKSAHLEALTNAVSIEKAAGVAAVAEVQKALDAQAEIAKSLQTQIETFKQAEAVAKSAARVAALSAALPAEQATAIVKATGVLDDEAFAAIVAGYAVTKAVDADMLTETGAGGNTEVDASKLDRTQEILKAKYTK